MEGRWRRTGVRETPEQVKAPGGFVGTQSTLAAPPSGQTWKSILAAWFWVQGAAVLHGSSLAPRSSPAISFASSLLCQSSTSGCL